VFGYLGSFMSLMVYLAPMKVFTFRRIYKEKSTVGHTFMPYIVAFFSSMLWMYYGLLGSTKPIIYINIVACIIECIYILMYLYYASKTIRMKVGKFVGLGIVIVFVTIIVTYITLQNKIIFRIKIVGWVATFFSLIVFGAPIKNVIEAFKTRNNEFVPIQLICCLTLTGLAWLGYGLAKKEIVIIVSHSIYFSLFLFNDKRHNRNVPIRLQNVYHTIYFSLFLYT
ncbi:hypothetical protein MIMGU_mgv1a018574mg, partial [Erythranthe guttata]